MAAMLGEYSLLSIIGWGAAILAGMFYVGVPLLVRFTHKNAAQPRFKVLSLGNCPRAVLTYLKDMSERLESAGFMLVGCMSMQQQTTGVTPYFALLIHRLAGDKAMACAIYTEAEGVISLGTRYVEFSTRYEDGRMIDTNNSAALDAFRSVPEKTVTKFPTVDDPLDLYALHQEVMREVAPGAKKVLPDEGAEVDYLSNVLIEDYERQCRLGMLYLDRAAAAYRPTMKGALLMTWGLLPPMKQIRSLQMNRAAKRRLQHTSRLQSA